MIAKIMNRAHDKIHLIMAVTAPPDFGDVAAAEFKMLTKQRKRVNKNPILPGTVSTGRRKLI